MHISVDTDESRFNNYCSFLCLSVKLIICAGHGLRLDELCVCENIKHVGFMCCCLMIIKTR